jgi:hypothetical protein
MKPKVLLLCSQSLSWVRRIQSTHFHPISLRSILILSFHLPLCLPRGFSLQVFRPKFSIHFSADGNNENKIFWWKCRCSLYCIGFWDVGKSSLSLRAALRFSKRNVWLFSRSLSISCNNWHFIIRRIEMKGTKKYLIYPSLTYKMRKMLSSQYVQRATFWATSWKNMEQN